MKYSNFAIRQLKDRLIEKAMKKNTPIKVAADMLEAAEVIAQLEKKCIKWVPTAERLPNKSGKYLCIPERTNYLSELPFSVEHQAFNVYDDWNYNIAMRNKIAVSYWSERPEMPEDANA